MKKILIVVLVLMSVSVFAELLDQIVAKVGRDIILRSDMEKRTQQLQAAGMLTPDISDTDILNDMIESKVIIQKAQKDEYETDDFKIKSLAEQQIKQISSQFTTEREFVNELKKAELTVIELKEYYILMLTEQSLRDQIIGKEITGKVNITEAEVEEFYEEKKDEVPLRPAMDKIGMIMRTMKPGKETKNKALKVINKIKDKLNEGVEFNEIIAASDEFGITGGDLGFFGKGTMVASFEEAAFNLIPGEISDVTETPFGYHLIKCEEKKGGEIRVSHVLKEVTPDEKDIVATNELMSEISTKLQNGDDFFELAKTYSEDDSTAVRGGVIGEFEKENYPELFKTYLSNLEYGTYSKVVEETGSLYIFGKLELVEERAYTYFEMYDKLRELVKAKKETELYEKWISELLQESYTEIFLND
jgi:peptidyl-prolyl cis-trans isomerase SurA